MKIVYLWKNGNPVIVNKNEDNEYIYPKEKYTEIKPPSGIYQPFYFDGSQWIGNTRSSWQQML
ncbi:hypothetical protein K2V49_03265 [Staphylococcus gallinarum]|uniref:hypothetical protein n=1 Tax=Staphylococcus gallinarum TaxID=1293 RepID=UPI001E5E0FD3|nr:hypothetical protein [Staphylococcus gallinarum]MCD8899318.1 hypothetical protein [Staphylococcus gallinarum]